MDHKESLIDAIVRDETRANLDGAPEVETVADELFRQRLCDALGPMNAGNLWKQFGDRHAIDKVFRVGDTVCVVGIPEVRGVVTRLYDNWAVRVMGIPGYTTFTVVAIEHAPDDDGVTRYHTESGEVFAECGTSTEPCEIGDTTDADSSTPEADGGWNERVVMCLEDFIHLVGTQRRLIDSLWVSCLAVTVMAVASLIVNVYLVMGGVK